MSQVHVMYNGESLDLEQAELDIGALSSDTEIRQAVAESLEVPVSKLSSFSVDKNTETGDITLRPQASFGN